MSDHQGWMIIGILLWIHAQQLVSAGTDGEEPPVSTVRIIITCMIFGLILVAWGAVGEIFQWLWS